ncbi:MAG: DUF72 domain-containing protein [Candidatus Marinimicrobia bacterium]|nr:DUF72 domain-containing protein [Candidatus Neomarinimicrobiota bacterium]
MAGRQYIGTCSWKYPSWEGLVYSSPKPDNYLEEYSRKYASVEIDQWFWSLFGADKIVMPKVETVKQYFDSVPDNFRFVIKAPNSISLTHMYKSKSSQPLQENPHFLSPELYETFLYAIQEMSSKVGAISLQFEYLNKLKMPSAQLFLDRFRTFVSKVDTTIPLCLEIRNPNFLTAQYFQLLKEHGIGHTFCQGYFMPDIRELYDKHSDKLEGTSIIRLLGPDRQGIEKISKKVWNRIVSPQDGEIPGIAKLIRRMVDQAGMDVYLNVNNHYEGSAPITIKRLLEYL